MSDETGEKTAMSCDIYRDLEGKLRVAKERRALFAYKENQHLWRTSAAQAGRIATEAQREMGELSEKMLAHREPCPLCLAEKR
ncbi:MAG TPA: hypothetical protein VK638_30365 [Edaphobacter sp.]|nr:hypothetical protein [Edaphobacter sp.]